MFIVSTRPVMSTTTSMTLSTIPTDIHSSYSDYSVVYLAYYVSSGGTVNYGGVADPGNVTYSYGLLSVHGLLHRLRRRLASLPGW